MRYRVYIIKQGDTLQSIAQEVSGNMSNWVDIAKYNNLKYPYIVATPEEKTINGTTYCYGDELIIPYESSLSELETLVLENSDKDDITRLALGVDLNLTADVGELQARGTTDEVLSLSSDKGGRISVVKGYNNLKQAILLRLNTPKGTMPLHPEYGSTFGYMLGKKNTYANAVIIKTEIERTIRMDKRVSEVTVDVAQINQESLDIKIVVVPMGFDEQIVLVTRMDDSGVIQIQ